MKRFDYCWDANGVKRVESEQGGLVDYEEAEDLRRRLARCRAERDAYAKALMDAGIPLPGDYGEYDGKPQDGPAGGPEHE